MSHNIKIDDRVVRNLSIAFKASVITSSFIIMINFFNQTVDYTNIKASLPSIAIIAVAWLVMTSLIVQSIASKLLEEDLSDTALYFFYILTVAPTTQLAFQLYKNVNNNVVDILPFIGLVLVINLLAIPIILNLIDSTKLTKKQQKTALLSAVIYCACATFLISFTSSL